MEPAGRPRGHRFVTHGRHLAVTPVSLAWWGEMSLAELSPITQATDSETGRTKHERSPRSEHSLTRYTRWVGGRHYKMRSAHPAVGPQTATTAVRSKHALSTLAKVVRTCETDTEHAKLARKNTCTTLETTEVMRVA